MDFDSGNGMSCKKMNVRMKDGYIEFGDKRGHLGSDERKIGMELAFDDGVAHLDNGC